MQRPHLKRSFLPQSPSDLKISMIDKSAKFGIGAIVKHRLYPFRGVVVDVDPEFDNTDEWYEFGSAGAPG